MREREVSEDEVKKKKKKLSKKSRTLSVPKRSPFQVLTQLEVA